MSKESRQIGIAGSQPSVGKEMLSRLSTLALRSAYLLLLQSIVLLLFQNVFELKLNLAMQVGALILFALFCKAAVGTYLSAPMVFASSIFIWHSTFLLGHFFEVAPIFAFDFGTFDIGFEHIYKATALVGLSLSLAIIGMIWAYRRERIEARTRIVRPTLKRECYSSFHPSARRVAWYLFASMVAILAFFLAQEGRNAFAGKYIDLYASTPSSFSAVLFFRTELFWPFVIILLIACYRCDTRVRYLVAIAVVSICGLLAMLGPRTGPFVCLTALLLSWDSFAQRVKLRWIVGFILFLSVASYVIESGRITGLGIHVFQFGDTGKDSLDLLALFHEQGRSIETVLRTMEFSERNGLMYGRSFVDAAVAVIPLPILRYTGYKFAESTADWIAENSPDIGVNEGAGSSLIAELYHNFGMVGSLGFLFIGWYIGRAYFKYSFTGNIFTGLIVMTVVAIYTVMMRNEVSSVFRLLVYALLIVTILRHKREQSFISQYLSREQKSSIEQPPFQSLAGPTGLASSGSET